MTLCVSLYKHVEPEMNTDRRDYHLEEEEEEKKKEKGQTDSQ